MTGRACSTGMAILSICLTARSGSPVTAGEIMRAAARRAALVSGSLALPPGPLGIATVLHTSAAQTARDLAALGFEP